MRGKEAHDGEQQGAGGEKLQRCGAEAQETEVRATREPEGSSERVRGNTQNTETTSGGSAIPRLPTVVKR